MNVKELQNELLNLLFFKSLIPEKTWDHLIFDKKRKEYLIWKQFKKVWEKLNKTEKEIQLETKFLQDFYFWNLNTNLNVKSIVYTERNSWEKLWYLYRSLFLTSSSHQWELLSNWFEIYTKAFYSFQSLWREEIHFSKDSLLSLTHSTDSFLSMFIDFLIRYDLKENEIQYLITKYKYLFLFFYSSSKFIINKYNNLILQNKTKWIVTRSYLEIIMFYHKNKKYFNIFEWYINNNWKIYWSEVNKLQNKFEKEFQQRIKVRNSREKEIYIFSKEEFFEHVKRHALKTWSLSIFWMLHLSAYYWWLWHYDSELHYIPFNLENFNDIIDELSKNIEQWKIEIRSNLLYSTKIWLSSLNYLIEPEIIFDLENNNHIEHLKSITNSFENYLTTVLKSIKNWKNYEEYEKNIIFSDNSYSEIKSIKFQDYEYLDNWYIDWLTLNKFWKYFSIRQDMKQILYLFFQNYFNFKNHYLFMKTALNVLNWKDDNIKKRIKEYLVNTTLEDKKFYEQIDSFLKNLELNLDKLTTENKNLIYDKKEIQNINQCLLFMKEDLETSYWNLYDKIVK